MRKFLACFLAAVLILNAAVLADCAERNCNNKGALWSKKTVLNNHFLAVEGMIRDCCRGYDDSLAATLIWRRKGFGEAEERPRDLWT